MKGYDIPIFWHTDETRQYEDMGMDVPLDEGTEKVCTFYQVSCVTPYEGKYCKIYSGGEAFISPLSMTEVKLLLED